MLTNENTDSDLNVHTLHYANELLVRVRRNISKTSASVSSGFQTREN